MCLQEEKHWLKKKKEEIKDNLRECFSIYYVEIKLLNIYYEFLILCV